MYLWFCSRIENKKLSRIPLHKPSLYLQRFDGEDLYMDRSERCATNGTLNDQRENFERFKKNHLGHTNEGREASRRLRNRKIRAIFPHPFVKGNKKVKNELPDTPNGKMRRRRTRELYSVEAPISHDKSRRNLAQEVTHWRAPPPNAGDNNIPLLLARNYRFLGNAVIINELHGVGTAVGLDLFRRI
ncbi:hypothetical protein Tco_0530223 [Tanacetum coccineum]